MSIIYQKKKLIVQTFSNPPGTVPCFEFIIGPKNTFESLTIEETIELLRQVHLALYDALSPDQWVRYKKRIPKFRFRKWPKDWK